MPKQLEISGTERPVIKEIEDAAEAYVRARDKRMKLTGAQCEAKAALLTVVKAHEGELSVDGEGNRVYRYDDYLVTLKSKRNIKVKTAHEDEDSEGDDE
jgi:hypothetical protein